MRRVLRHIALCVALTATISCGRDSTGPLAAQLGSITIVDPPTSLDLRFSAELNATVRDKAGVAVLGVPIRWWSSAPMTVVVQPGGSTKVEIAGAQLGEATVYAQAGALTDSVRISVVPPPVASISVSPLSALLGTGRTIQLDVRAFDAHGVALDDRPATFTSSDPTVADVSSTGALSGGSVGSSVVTIAVESISTTMRVSVTQATTINITANILNPFPNALAPDLTATLRGLGDSLVTSPLGSANQATISGSIGLPSTADIVIGPMSNQFTRAAVAYYAAADLPSSVTMIAVPTAYDIVAAFAPVCDNSANADCQSFFPSYFGAGVKAWAPGSLPIPVMFDRSRSNILIGDADSVTLWQTLNDFQTAMGQTLFVPATMTTPSNAGYVIGAITVAIDTTIAHSGGEANWYWNSRDEIQAAQISFKGKSLLVNGPVIKHEFMHALGLHHTCRWPSVMGGYGCAMYDLTSDDVGYAHAAWHVRDAEANLRTTTGSLPPNVLSLGAVAQAATMRGSRFTLITPSFSVSRGARISATPAPVALNPLGLPNFHGADSAH